jgi:hypothetical protein
MFGKLKGLAGKLPGKLPGLSVLGSVASAAAPVTGPAEPASVETKIGSEASKEICAEFKKILHLFSFETPIFSLLSIPKTI